MSSPEENTSLPEKKKRRLAEIGAVNRKQILAGLSDAEIEKKLIDEIGAYSDKEWHIAYREYNAHRPEPLPMTHIPAHKVDALVKQYNERYKRQLPAKRAYDKIRQKKIKESKKLENTSASVPNTSASVPNDLDSIPFEFDEDFLSQDVDQHDGGKRSRTKHRRIKQSGNKRSGTRRSGTRQSGTRRKTYKRK